MTNGRQAPNEEVCPILPCLEFCLCNCFFKLVAGSKRKGVQNSFDFFPSDSKEMPANTLTVQECGAYKQQIEKEIRSLRPRNPAPYATLGPYAIPPPPPSFHESATQCADGSTNNKPQDRVTTPRANSRSSSRGNSRSSSRITEQLSSRLQTLEQELSRERDSRRAAEEKLDKLQATLEKIASEKKSQGPEPTSCA